MDKHKQEQLLCYNSDAKPSSGFMPFTQAAFWIATDGGQSSIKLENTDVWETAYSQLLKRIASEEVKIIGRRRGSGFNDTVPHHLFSGIRVAYPGQDLADALGFGSYPYILCYGPVDDEHWQRQDGFDDKIFASGRSMPEWTHLQVSASDVARLWPFGSERHDVGFADTAALDNVTSFAGAIIDESASRPSDPHDIITIRGGLIGPDGSPLRDVRSSESTPAAALPNAPKRRGRHSEWDQEEAIQFLCQEFDRRGHFDEPNQDDDWNRQRHAEDAVINHFMECSKAQEGPSRATARRLVKLADKQWRAAENQGSPIA